MKKLPIGIQSFQEMIKSGYIYVDKTEHIKSLIEYGKYIFLSRPRRFGKSLLISTLSEIFSGNKEFFQGLFIYDKIEWKSYPVILLDFSLIDYSTEEELRQGLIRTIDTINKAYKLGVESFGFKSYFHDTIRELYKKYDKVIVLIDEYDKPIIDFVDDIEKAKNYRDILRDFYQVLKGSDLYLKFVFITGVSKFSRVSVFSGLNNLQDITLTSQMSNLLGYTEEEIECYFEEYIHVFCEEWKIERKSLLENIRTWYNGYSWNGINRVYNPFSILNLFAEKRFSNYWFATGTPTFLMKLIKNEGIEASEFENKKVPEIIFDSYDLENMNIFSLLFQTGYLTISHIERKMGFLKYILGYPNLEVKNAFLAYLFETFTAHRLDEIQITAEKLRLLLEQENLNEFLSIIKSLFAKIPYTLHIEKEAYYHSLFYMILALMGLEIDLEVLTDKGRIDGVLKLEGKVYIIEFKYGKPGTDIITLVQKALTQIKEKNYGERFNDFYKRIYLGVGFVEKEIAFESYFENQ
jgi:hypothetical protein